jgi:DNA-binding NarL/FixJ family response regulator
LKILIVDDHVNVRRITAEFLHGPQIQIVECASGEAAVLAYAEHRPDWVTMDVEMPGIGGFQAAREIKKLFPDARIIFLTLHDNAGLRINAIDAGGHGYVVKDSMAQLKVLMAQSIAPPPRPLP